MGLWPWPVEAAYSRRTNHQFTLVVLIYEKIGQQIAGFSKEKTLMIGDSLTADIQGGNNAGIDTIWYNPHHLENHTQAQPTYEVYSYQDLLDCLDKNILEKITF
ncbi:haloacid dehalogenase-like hydrolase [Streptococcus pneumoniae]|nr:haloacid dehalogenase-like hydrolase [Streptococcus pneumoniae]